MRRWSGGLLKHLTKHKRKKHEPKSRAYALRGAYGVTASRLSNGYRPLVLACGMRSGVDSKLGRSARPWQTGLKRQRTYRLRSCRLERGRDTQKPAKHVAVTDLKVRDASSNLAASTKKYAPLLKNRGAYFFHRGNVVPPPWRCGARGLKVLCAPRCHPLLSGRKAL